MSSPSQAPDSTEPSFNLFNTISETAKSGLDQVKKKFETFKSDNPKLYATIKKIIPFAILALALFISPLATAIGFGVGFVFSKQLSPIIKDVEKGVVDAFKSANIYGKALIGAGILGSLFLIPSAITGLMVGTEVGARARTYVNF